MAEPTTPAAWYVDPVDASRLRYWDGAVWTDHLRPAAGSTPDLEPTPATEPVPAPSPALTVTPEDAAVENAAAGQRHSRALPPANEPAASRRARRNGRGGWLSFRARLLVGTLAVLLVGALWAGWQSSRAPTDQSPVVIVPQTSPTPTVS